MEPISIIEERKELQEQKNVRKVLLICGILAPLLWVGTDILAGTLYPGYTFTSQAISELFAIGAPTSGLVIPLFTVYDILLVAFALGVWMSAGRNRTLHIVALMMAGNAVNGLVLWNFFPMHMRGAEATFTDNMHVTLAGVGVIFVLLALGFGATTYRNWFRFYSIGTILTLLVAGVVMFGLAASGQHPLTPPWFGVIERINVYGYLLWILVLAVILLHAESVRLN